jgi:ankyrin repeat protein
MRDPYRLAQIACDAGIIQTERLQPLRPQEPRPQWASAADVAAARNILVQQRRSSDSWKDPLKQKRRLLRPKGKNEFLANPENWTFSRAERSVALDVHIRGLAPVGIAQAILDFDRVDEPLDVNLIYTEESKDKNNPNAGSRENNWLEYVAGKDSLEYVTLLASYPIRQSAKDSALSIDLSRRSMPIVKELLRHHANPNGHHNTHFIPAIAEGDIELVELFLSAPNPLSDSVIDAGLLKAVDRAHSALVSLLIAHGADPNYKRGRALETAILNRTVRDVALICSKSQKTLIAATFNNSISAVCAIADETERNSLVEMLLCAGADANHTALQDHLLQAVKTGRASAVSFLVAHGTFPGRRDAECLQLAVQSLRIDLVEILLQSDLSLSAKSKALESIPEEASEDEFRKLAILLLDKGVTAEALSACLGRVVAKPFDSLAITLVRRGASLDYDDVACIRFVLREQNITLLRDLLEGSCTASTLVKALPEAMAIRSVIVRRDAMALLLSKGVSGRELHRALRTVIGESTDLIDYELANLLIQHKASVDFCGSKGNCLQIAAERGDLKAIELLCGGSPSPDTVSAALSRAFASFGSRNYSDIYNILAVLLRPGARGAPLAEALIEAVRQDHDGRIIALLLESGADANYKTGKPIECALSASDSNAFKLICENVQLERECLERLALQVLDPPGFSMDKARLLLRCCTEFREILDLMLLVEVESLGCRREVIELLLELEASVGFRQAAALRFAVQAEDVETTRILLSRQPSKAHLSLAFEAAATMRGKHKRFDLMRLLLEHGGPSIAEDDILLREVRLTEGKDLSYVRLLLDYGASADYQGGAPIQAAVNQKHDLLFDFLMSQGPNSTSLANAFAAGRKATISNRSRLHVFNSLLRAGFRDSEDNQVSQALIEAIQRDPSDIKIPRLLLECGASVESTTRVVHYKAQPSRRRCL